MLVRYLTTNQLVDKILAGSSGIFLIEGAQSGRVIHPQAQALLTSWLTPEKKSPGFTSFGHVSNVAEESAFCVDNFSAIVILENGILQGIAYGWIGFFPQPEGHEEFQEGGQEFVHALWKHSEEGAQPLLESDSVVTDTVGLHYIAVEQPGKGLGRQLLDAFVEVHRDRIIHADLQDGSVAEKLCRRVGFYPSEHTTCTMEGDRVLESWVRYIHVPRFANRVLRNGRIKVVFWDHM